MEATINTTNNLTTAAAWRTAINLTVADVRQFLIRAFEVIKCLAAVLYLLTALCLLFNESDVMTYNVIGGAMMGLFALIVKKNR